MRFWQAMKALEEGKKIRKRDWPSSNYITLKDTYIVDDCYNAWEEKIDDLIHDQNWEIFHPNLKKGQVWGSLGHVYVLVGDKEKVRPFNISGTYANEMNCGQSSFRKEGDKGPFYSGDIFLADSLEQYFKNTEEE